MPTEMLKSRGSEHPTATAENRIGKTYAFVTLGVVTALAESESLAHSTNLDSDIIIESNKNLRLRMHHIF